MSYDAVIGDTLALVNVARMAYGKDPLTELPDAQRGNASDCLYARALRDIGAKGVSGGGGIEFSSERIAAHVASLWGVEESGNVVHAPPQFGEVIGAFDNSGLGYSA